MKPEQRYEFLSEYLPEEGFREYDADALELVALRREPINLTEKQKQWLKENTPEEVPLYVTETLLQKGDFFFQSEV